LLVQWIHTQQVVPTIFSGANNRVWKVKATNAFK
jgi:hypothetical protein